MSNAGWLAEICDLDALRCVGDGRIEPLGTALEEIPRNCASRRRSWQCELRVVDVWWLGSAFRESRCVDGGVGTKAGIRDTNLGSRRRKADVLIIDEGRSAAYQ